MRRYVLSPFCILLLLVWGCGKNEEAIGLGTGGSTEVNSASGQSQSGRGEVDQRKDTANIGFMAALKTNNRPAPQEEAPVEEESADEATGKEDPHRARFAAVEVMIQNGTPGAKEAFTELLENTDSRIRIAAQSWIGTWADQDPENLKKLNALQ